MPENKNELVPLVPLVSTRPQDEALTRLSEALGKNPVALYLARLAPGSRRTQSEALKQIARWLHADDPYSVRWSELRYEHTIALRTMTIESPLDETGKTRQPSTVNRYLAALRGVLKEAWRLGLMSTDDYMRAKEVPDLKDDSPPAGRELSEDELSRLEQACRDDSSPYGLRDLAMLTLFRHGLRRFEVVGARMDLYDATTGELQIIGKGKKFRKIFLNQHHRDVLVSWFAVRPAGEHIISDLLRGRKLTEQSVTDILNRRAKQAQITRHFSSHDFRRTFASRQLARTGDLATVQKLMGHSDPKTTVGYDRRGDETLKNATEEV